MTTSSSSSESQSEKLLKNVKLKNVKLFPEQNCSCKFLGKSKAKWTHLLAVMNANGHPITDGYKLPKLNQLTRSKRNGRKRHRDRKNAKSVVAPTVSVASNASESRSACNASVTDTILPEKNKLIEELNIKVLIQEL